MASSLAVALYAPFAIWSLQGADVPGVAWPVLAVLVWVVEAERASRPWPVGAFPTLALAILVRADVTVAYVVVLALSAAVALAALAYDVRVGGDWIDRLPSRFIAPVMPIFVALLVGAWWLFCRALGERVAGERRPDLFLEQTRGLLRRPDFNQAYRAALTGEGDWIFVRRGSEPRRHDSKIAYFEISSLRETGAGP